MRTFILLGLLVLAPLSAFAHRDRIEPARTVTVNFKAGESVTFAISDVAITAVTLHIGKADYALPQSECDKLRDVRFETVSFLWNGSFESVQPADYFYLRFEMGTEKARSFGVLPRVQLMFRAGKFAEATVRKQISEDEWEESNL